MAIKKHLACFVFLFLIIWSIAYSQDSTEVKSSLYIKNYKKEFAINLEPLFGKYINSRYPMLFFRYNHSRKGKYFTTIREGYRLQLNLSISDQGPQIKFLIYNDDFTDSLLVDERRTRGSNIVLTPGYEIQYNFDKFQFIYGVDFKIQYATSTDKGKTFKQEVFNNQYRYESVGLSSFIGLKYFINRRISVSVETSLSLIYFKQRLLFQLWKDEKNIIDSNYLNSNWNVKFLPIDRFNISFYF